MKTNRQTLVISDGHGCLDEVKQLLADVKFDPEKIRLVFLGDLCSRHPDWNLLVQFVKDLCDKGHAECVRGNHDQKFFMQRKAQLANRPHGFRINERNITIANRLSNDEIGWLGSIPIKIDLGNNWYAVHGGCEQAFPFEYQDADVVMRIRYVSDGQAVDRTGKVIAAGKMVGYSKGERAQPKHTKFWAEAWEGKQNIVFGHSYFEKPAMFKNKNNTCVGIDTGCIYGGYLTGFFVEDRSFVQVKALKTYYKK